MITQKPGSTSDGPHSHLILKPLNREVIAWDYASPTLDSVGPHCSKDREVELYLVYKREDIHSFEEPVHRLKFQG